MGATQALPNKTPVAVVKDPLPDLMTRLPLGSTLRPTLVLLGNETDAKRRWEIKHEKLNFWVVRDTPEEAIRAFLHAVDKRGLREVLEGPPGFPLDTPPIPQAPVFKPTVV